MTWNPNATFTTQLESRENAPIFVVVIDGVSTIYSTGDVTFAGKTTKQILSL